MKTSYLPALKQVICEDNIPSTLGGKCTCFSSPEMITCCTCEGCTILPELQKMDDYIMREHQKQIGEELPAVSDKKMDLITGPPAMEEAAVGTMEMGNEMSDINNSGLTHIVSEKDIPVVDTTNQYVDNNQMLQPVSYDSSDNMVYYQQQPPIQQDQPLQQQPQQQPAFTTTTTTTTVDSKKFMPGSLGVKDINGNYVISQQQMDPQQYNRTYMD